MKIQPSQSPSFKATLIPPKFTKKMQNKILKGIADSIGTADDIIDLTNGTTPFKKPSLSKDAAGWSFKYKVPNSGSDRWWGISSFKKPRSFKKCVDILDYLKDKYSYVVEHIKK